MNDAGRQITEEELKKCDGQEGRPAWVAYRGKVYDVSASQRWSGGTHMKRHQAGIDLTTEFAAAPHDESVLQRMPVVGRLVAAEQAKVHPLVEAYLDLHPHPVSVHFPIALTLTSAAFLLIYLVTDIESLVDGAYYTLLVGAIISPFTIVTGAASWWFSYRHRLTSTFKGKAGLSAALFVTGVVTAVMWAPNRDALIERDAVGWAYLALVLVMCGLVLSLGKLGGALVFPPRKKRGQKSSERNGN